MKRLSCTKGVTVIEVMAAVGIFALVASGLTANTVAIIRNNMISKKAATASALIHDKVEYLRALDPEQSPPDFEPGAHSDALNPMNPLGQQGGDYIRTWVVTRDTPATGLAEIEVTVAWQKPTPSSITGVTYVCQTGTCG